MNRPSRSTLRRLRALHRRFPQHFCREAIERMSRGEAVRIDLEHAAYELMHLRAGYRAHYTEFDYATKDAWLQRWLKMPAHVAIRTVALELEVAAS